MSILITSVPVIDDSEKVVKVFYIYYLIQVEQDQIQTLLDRESEVNAINLDYAWKLGLKIWKTNIRAKKMDGSTLKTFGMVNADFQIEDKVNRPRFFQKIFLVINTKFEVILKILFLKINNADVLFDK